MTETESTLGLQLDTEEEADELVTQLNTTTGLTAWKHAEDPCMVLVSGSDEALSAFFTVEEDN